ncbi:MAG: cytochrome-c oxidase, cbb3-type subunit III [Steroidobacteraceae bacterium]|jgi:cytochrome c oxidase cbb3-type subunit 3|nr:cytochrome-c oxidase, cbb3-type subunit III [Steroidobacteraceae bacterium]
MSGFWNGWIVVLTLANVAGALWLLWATSRREPNDARAEQGDPDTTGHTWDGDLKEYNNPLPRWWLWLFYGSVAFGVGYMVLFPALGSFGGALGWSQAGQWQAQTLEAERRANEQFAKFAGKSVVELQRDPDAMRVARNLYANNCAMCHGSDARGAKGFPNLHATNFQYGKEPDTLVATIALGRQGVMPAWADALGAQGVEEVASYVYSLSGRKAPADLVAGGQAKFGMFCASCHGADGTGMPVLGAPNLTDQYWTYGGSIEAIKETITAGRQNQMPAHLDLLGEQRVKLLAAYVLSLGPPAAEPATQTAQNVPAADAAAAVVPVTGDASGH